MKRLHTLTLLVATAFLLSACIETLGIAAATMGFQALTNTVDTIEDTFERDLGRQIAANAKKDDRVAVGMAKCMELAGAATEIEIYIKSFDSCMAVSEKYQPTFLVEQVIGRIRDDKAARAATDEKELLK